MPTVAGMDIAQKRWALVELTWNDGEQIRLVSRAVPYDELQIAAGWSLSVIDIPVGLLQDHEAAVSDKGRTGDRPIDRGARKWCRSPGSVFPPPTTGQLSSGILEHSRAAAAQSRTDQKRSLSAVHPGGLSKQTFELLPAIHDAASIKTEHPNEIFESHPEVVFSVIATGLIPLSKMSLAGALMRARLLSDRLGVDILRWALEQEGVTKLGADNWLDAVAMALVAMDWVRSPDERKVMCDDSGHVTNWDEKSNDFLLAMPNTTLITPRRRIGCDAAISSVLASLPSG